MDENHDFDRERFERCIQGYQKQLDRGYEGRRILVLWAERLLGYDDAVLTGSGLDRADIVAHDRAARTILAHETLAKIRLGFICTPSLVDDFYWIIEPTGMSVEIFGTSHEELHFFKRQLIVANIVQWEQRRDKYRHPEVFRWWRVFKVPTEQEEMEYRSQQPRTNNWNRFPYGHPANQPLRFRTYRQAKRYCLRKRVDPYGAIECMPHEPRCREVIALCDEQIGRLTAVLRLIDAGEHPDLREWECPSEHSPYQFEGLPAA